MRDYVTEISWFLPDCPSAIWILCALSGRKNENKKKLERMKNIRRPAERNSLGEIIAGTVHPPAEDKLSKA